MIRSYRWRQRRLAAEATQRIHILDSDTQTVGNSDHATMNEASLLLHPERIAAAAAASGQYGFGASSHQQRFGEAPLLATQPRVDDV